MGTFDRALAGLYTAVERVYATQDTLDGQPVTGVYSAPYIDPLGLASTEPTYELRTAGVTAHQGSVLVCAAGTFRVRVPQPDGVGWQVLTLERLS